MTHNDESGLIVITPERGTENGWFTVRHHGGIGTHNIEVRARNITVDQYTRVYIDVDTARALIEALQIAIEGGAE